MPHRILLAARELSGVRTLRSFSIVRTGAAIVLVISLLAGCRAGASGLTTPIPLSCTTDANAPLALAIGARANNPTPILSDGMTQLVTQTAGAGRQISLIRLDGNPKLVFAAAFRSQAANSAARKLDLNSYMQRIQTVLGSDIHAQVPEADVLAALTLAAASVGPSGNIIVIDSGIQTTGSLDFRQGLTDADPNDVVNFLKKRHLLPDLAGRRVLLSGFGFTALPQQPLDNSRRSNIVAIWKAIAVTAGALCVGVDTQPNTQAALSGVPSVAPVLLPPRAVFEPCGETQLSEKDQVGFVRGTAVFRDPQGAQATLKKLAEILLRGNQQLTLTGTTSSEGDRVANLELSKKRAEMVKRVLVAQRIAADRITTVGAGSEGPGHVTDLGPDGSLLPGPAIQNRKVIAHVTCPSG
jgi:OOP family OmpA-OmpF porin